jgi:glutathione S-transferase
LADVEITPYVERIDRLGLSSMWDSRPRLADWFKRIKSRPSFAAIADYPPSDYDDRGRDGAKDWPRIKEMIAA